MKRPKRIWLPMIVLLVALGLVAWWRRGWLERSQDRPIRAAAERYQVDPALVKAVVWRESRFDPEARGRAGEMGLMQLREDAAREWADAEGIEAFEHEHCLNPVTNTLAGAFYLGKLLKRFAQADDPRPYALAAYNAGRSNALKWATGEAATNSARFIEQIAFPATRAYVLAVLDRARKYQRDFPPVARP